MYLCDPSALTGAVADSNPLKTLLKSTFEAKVQMSLALKRYKEESRLEEVMKAATKSKLHLMLWSYIFKIVQEISNLIEILETKL